MRRSKQNSDYFHKRIEKIFEQIPESKLVKNRYRTIRALLDIQRYSIFNDISQETLLEYIKDCVWLDRELRKLTSKEERELKQKLSLEKQQQLGYGKN